MLASPYLTPSQLGITPEIFAALLTIRDELRAGELEHWRYGLPRPGGGRGFNMGWWQMSDEVARHHQWAHGLAVEGCGTVCCIGGWLHQRGVMGDPNSGSYPSSLMPLFLPHTGGYPKGEFAICITPGMAADAIDRWLAGDQKPHAPR